MERSRLTHVVAQYTAAVGYVPTRSAVIAGSVALITMLSVGAVLGEPVVVGGGILSGLALAVAIAAVDHDRLWAPIIGGGLLVGVTPLIVGLPVYFILVGDGVGAGLMLGSVLVGLGLARFRIDAIGEGAVSRALAWLVRVGVVFGVLTLVVATLVVDIGRIVDQTFLGTSFETLLTPTSGSEGVLGFVVLSWVTLACLWLFSAVMPPADVFDSPLQERYRASRVGFVRVTALVFGLGGLAIALGYTVSVELGILSDLLQHPIDTLVATPGVRTLFVRLGLVALVCGLLIHLGRAAGPAFVYGRPAWIPSGVVMIVVLTVGAAVSAGPLLTQLTRSLPDSSGQVEGLVALVGYTPLAMGLLVVGLGVIGGALLLFPLLSGVGLLPAYTAGPRLALFGLLLAAITSSVAGAPTVVVIGTVVAAIIVWDIAEHGTELTTEVGRHPSHMEGELVHAGGSLLVGVGTLGGLLAAQTLLFEVTISEDAALLVVGLAVFAAVIGAVALRK